MSVGIVGYGVYIPKYRLKREDIARVWGGRAPGINEKSVVGFDEDATTMAVAAAQNAIAHAGVAPSEVGALYVGSVSSPYISKSMAVIIAEALGMS
ncbi:MAG: hydroxymethylglutaryl-CoA synthase, partial [Deltaproteobacteria bacterium CG_4_10_14_0_8_um_filter_43_12]